LAQACAEIIIFGQIVFGQESDLRLFDFCILFFPLGFFFAALIDPFPGLLGVKKGFRKIHRGGQFYHGAARCSGGKFGSEFFTQRFEHFCAYFSFQ